MYDYYRDKRYGKPKVNVQPLVSRNGKEFFETLGCLGRPPAAAPAISAAAGQNVSEN
jgi:hypothetical protein